MEGTLRRKSTVNFALAAVAVSTTGVTGRDRLRKEAGGITSETVRPVKIFTLGQVTGQEDHGTARRNQGD